MQPLKRPAIGLGVSYIVGVVLLSDLLGSTADASDAFTEHFAEDAAANLDAIGSLALVVAAGFLVATVVATRHACATADPGSRDLASALGLIGAAAMTAASGLLLTVPLTTLIGRMTDDPGLEDSVQAGIAQAGTVSLLVAVLPVAVAAVLLARLGVSAGQLPKQMLWAAWIVAATLLLGASVVLLLPFGLWAIALGFTWRTAPPTEG